MPEAGESTAIVETRASGVARPIAIAVNTRHPTCVYTGAPTAVTGVQKEKVLLDETVKKIEVSHQPSPQPPKIKKKVKKIIYESENSEDEEEEEEVIIKKKREPKPRSYSELADMSVEQQIKNKLQQEKITCFFNQLTGKKY